MNVIHPLSVLSSFAAQTGRTPEQLFGRIYEIFLLLGTAVGVVVIGYMLYNAYKYRGGANRFEESDVDRPRLGELPTGGGKGRKLLVSLLLSAVIVVSLIVWTYTSLLYVEAAPEKRTDSLDVRVEGYQFGWEFVYPNGHRSGTLRVPRGRTTELTVTSRDVFHNFGIPAFKAKADAIPGQTTNTWFVADETGTYRAQCYELCGTGHSYMYADVVVMEPEAFREWYANTSGTTPTGGNGTTGGGAAGNTTAARLGGAP